MNSIAHLNSEDWPGVAAYFEVIRGLNEVGFIDDYHDTPKTNQ